MSEVDDTDSVEILHKTGAGDSVDSILIRRDGGNPERVVGTARNQLLFIHGLYDFLKGGDKVDLSTEPYVAVRATQHDGIYILWCGDMDSPVMSSPKDSEKVLRGVKDAKNTDGEDTKKIEEVYQNIIDNQVRRNIIKFVYEYADWIDKSRVEITPYGWLVDKYYLIDWVAKMYATEDDSESPDLVRSGSDVSEADKSYELLELDINEDELPEGYDIIVDGEEVTLGKREIVFISKIRWLQNRFENHRNVEYWIWQERQREQYLERKGEDYVSYI